MAEKNIRTDGKGRFNFTYILAGLIVLGIVIVLISSMLRSGSEDSRSLSINERLERMENRLSGIDAINEKLSSLDRQITGFQIALTERINSLESYMSQKITSPGTVTENAHSEAISTVKKPATVLQASADSRAKEETARFHQVQAGETLYRISLRYGLTVEELKRLNKLASGSVIHVGQNLKVSE